LEKKEPERKPRERCARSEPDRPASGKEDPEDQKKDKGGRRAEDFRKDREASARKRRHLGDKARKKRLRLNSGLPKL